MAGARLAAPDGSCHRLAHGYLRGADSNSCHREGAATAESIGMGKLARLARDHRVPVDRCRHSGPDLLVYRAHDARRYGQPRDAPYRPWARRNRCVFLVAFAVLTDPRLAV